MAETPGQNPYAILIPYPPQGHLASHGFTVTFVNTDAVHHQISASRPLGFGHEAHDIFVEARKSGLDIRYATVSDGFPVGFDRSLHHDQFMEGVLHPTPSTFGRPLLPTNMASLMFLSGFRILLSQSTILDKREDAVNYIPGVRSIKPTDLMSYLQATDTSTVVHRIIYKAFEDVKKADMIVCNTQPTYAVGPIFSSGFTKSIVATNMWPKDDCTSWLNLSFRFVHLIGSYAHATKHDIVEIAHGILLSGVSFLWVLRPDIVSSNDNDFLPGLMVPWCCQTAVISHPAIGGFLTHCGWNSILEKVLDKIHHLMIGKKSDELRNAIQKVEKTLEDAIATGGSSHRNFSEFLGDVKAKVEKRKEISGNTRS
ncbi:7-deoxyloganetin glucosyltransferase [Bertholletia excelsa]